MPDAYSKKSRQKTAFSSLKHVTNSLEIIREAINRYNDIVLPSGFNLNGVVLIDLAVKAAYRGKLLFVDTAYHFTETLQTRDNIAKRYPQLEHITLSANRPDDRLIAQDTDACCTLRKVQPLQLYLEANNISAVFSARSRDQSSTRLKLSALDKSARRVKVNPLVDWLREQLKTYAKAHALPVNPLYWDGFLSIGCAPCTRAVKPGESIRAGRWAGSEKLECGLWTGGI